MNNCEISIEYIDDDVQISKINDNCSEGMERDDEIDYLLKSAVENRN